MAKQALISLFFCLVYCQAVFSARNIAAEGPSKEDLPKLVKAFNDWHRETYPSANKVELRIKSDGSLGVFATAEIKEGENFLEAPRDKTINAESVHTTFVGRFIKELEEKYGYDDFTNFLFYLLHEKRNADSKWAPFLALLPARPLSPAFNYWEHSSSFEGIMENHNIIRKTVDYKFKLERKTRAINEVLVEKNREHFDPEYYHTDNLEWATYTLDSKQVLVNYEAYLIPLASFVSYGVNPANPEKISDLVRKDKSDIIELPAVKTFAKDEEIYFTSRINGQNLLLYQGIVLDNSPFDCYGLNVSFSQNKDDPLSNKRKEFFAKFFLYDAQHVDVIEECIGPKNFYPRRLFFYYYSLMMEEPELELNDPKRFDLEQDRIILEFVRNNLQNHYDLYPTKVEQDIERLATENDPTTRTWLRFRINQKKILLGVIERYNNDLNNIMKDDSL